MIEKTPFESRADNVDRLKVFLVDQSRTNLENLVSFAEYFADIVQYELEDMIRDAGFAEPRAVIEKSLLWHTVVGSTLSPNWDTKPQNEAEANILSLVDQRILEVLKERLGFEG